MPKNGSTQKKTTINDIALAAGVTKATVSLVLSNKGNISPAKRREIRRIAHRLNYEPNPHAQRLSNGRCLNMVALFSLHMDLGVGTYKLQIIQRLLAEQGYEIPAYLYGYCAPGEVNHRVELLRSICRQNPQAIICNCQDIGEQGWEEVLRYQQAGGVVVAYDYQMQLDCDRVVFDREDNTYQAALHLLKLGHRNIGYAMTGHPQPDGERWVGFCRALREFGVAPDERCMLGTRHYGYNGGLYEEGGVQLARQVMSMKEPPTALCIMDDSIAVACAAEFQRGGWRVPEDISIVGHDDSPIARYGPLPLTTVVQPTEAIAHEVINLLQERIKSGPELPPREVILQGKLVVRQSTAPPRKTQSVR